MKRRNINSGFLRHFSMMNQYFWQYNYVQRVRENRGQLDFWGKQVVKYFEELYQGIRASQLVLVVKNPPANPGDIREAGLIPESARSPGGWHGISLVYSWLENPMMQEPGMLQSIGSQNRTQLNWLNMDIPGKKY